MKRKSIKLIQNLKNLKKITCLTAYTTSIAKIIDNYVDVILIGDSVGTAIYGMSNTQDVTIDMMISHGRAVVNSSQKAFTVIDMPYKTYKNKKEALANAKKLIKSTKCQSVKLEADYKTLEIIEHLKKNNIEVISHIGVTPQKFKDFRKIRSVGKSSEEEEMITNLALRLEKAGSSMIVLECMKEKLAMNITRKLKIPTIGIGASAECDGQILVINDILNTENLNNKPRFIKSYTNLQNIIEKAVRNYSKDIENKKFPKAKNTY